MAYYTSEEALVTYNKIFGTSLAGNVDGGLTVTMHNKTLEIFGSGEVVMVIPHFSAEPKNVVAPISYPVAFLDELKEAVFDTNETDAVKN